MPNSFARTLRNNATPAERILWQQLKLLKAEGRHFRRQVQLDRYVADFACHYPKVVVELDGGQHGDALAYDEHRSQILKRHGYDVLRFWNADVFEALEGVVDRIRNSVRLKTLYSYPLSGIAKNKVWTVAVKSERPPPLIPPHKGEGNENEYETMDLVSPRRKN